MAYLTEVHSLLATHDVITSDVYCDIINALPARLNAKLRIVPDNALSAKLAHLYTVARIELKLEDISFDYDVVSVEGINDSTFFIDHDAIVVNKATNDVVIIDCTSDPRLHDDKLCFLAMRIKDRSDIHKAMVHLFKSKKFTIDVTVPVELSGVASQVFKMFDHVALLSTNKRNLFLEACESVYDNVVDSILVKENPNLNDRYKAWHLPEDIINIAEMLVKTHDVKDASRFKYITEKANLGVYLETFTKILNQQRPHTPPFSVASSTLNASNDLKTVLEKLNPSPVANALRLAMDHPKDWVAIGKDGRSYVNVNVPRSIKIILPPDSMFKICVKHIEGHTFMIKFDESLLDVNFKEQILKTGKIEKGSEFFSNNAVEAMTQIESLYAEYAEELMKPSEASSYNTIMGKIISLAKLYNNEPVVPCAVACGTLQRIAEQIQKFKLGDLINHNYEMAKTFAASLKVSPRADQYYVGVNGPFNSITVVRMSATQDSFNVSSYFCIYEALSPTHHKIIKNHHVGYNNIVQTKTRTFNKNTLTHALKLPFAFMSLVTWELENNTKANLTVSRGNLLRILVNSLLHVSVNSDQFAQCAEQIRYLFTSNVGYGASSTAICEKISFIRTNKMWEIMYIFRMLKMACGLNILFRTKNISKLLHEGKWIVAFPNSVNEIYSFSHMISSMYYCNIYNKFRAFHEVSEAICYNELEEENVIFLDAISRNRNEVVGITNESMAMILDFNHFDFDTFVARELAFCDDLVLGGPNRFKLSLSFIIGATRRHIKPSSEDISSLYKILNESPIDACTMNGAMESGIAKSEHQGIRAASAILEELFEQTGNDTKSINNNFLGSVGFINDLTSKPFDFSILSAVSRQYNFKGHYRYRIVQKDQKGHREISVLNAKFRLGALFCEKVAKRMSDLMQTDVLDDPNKDISVEQSVRKILHEEGSKFVISDNSDQRRWGPNHLLHSFSAMFFALLSDDPGLFRIINLILFYGENKCAKFPETLIDLFLKDKFNSNSAPIKSFFEQHLSSMKLGTFEQVFEWGMCQGIFHRTSSLYHGIMCNVVSDVCKAKHNFPDHQILSYVTSDDAERIIIVKEDVEDKISICKTVHAIINNVGCVMNILRNESKSVFSFHITEFNSIFYHNGKLATPTLKQRISKIDIGDGHDPALDYLTALSLSMGYFQNGGSYVGTANIMLLNIVLHTEQWNRWRFATLDNFRKPVEFGGFPVIEPLSVLYCGPISAFYLRSKDKCNSGTFSYLMAQTTLIDALEVNLEDFIRKPKDVRSDYDNDIKVFKSAGPMGAISLARTDKRLSKFERRHRISKWVIRPESISLIRTDPDAAKFVFNIMRITKTCQFEQKAGVNTFYIRFTDPWVNNSRECILAHKNSYFVKEVMAKYINEKNRISPKTWEEVLFSCNRKFISDFYEKLNRAAICPRERSSMEYRLDVLMADAEAVHNKLSIPEELHYLELTGKNSIVKVNLSSHTNIDEEEFHLSMLKSVIGEPIRNAIVSKSGTTKAWELIKIIPNTPKKDVMEGIFFCSNTLQIFDKYVRRHTKFICPGNKRPNDISELMEQIMLFKFTEKFGIKLKKFPTLKTASLPANVFRTCNSELLEKSLTFWRAKEKMINFWEDLEPSKFFVQSSTDVITNYDNFTLDDSIATDKMVEIHARGKFNFVQKIKLWVGANVTIKLSEIVKNSLLRNELTNFHEYCVTSQEYVKNQTGLASKVIIDGKECFEMQKFNVIENKYYHYFFHDSDAFIVKPYMTLKDSGKSKQWANKLKDFFDKKRTFVSGKDYDVVVDSRQSRDVLKFVKLSHNDTFKIRTFPNNLTIFLEHLSSSIIIPVCSQQLEDVDTMDLGMRYTPDHYKEAVESFAEIFDELNGHEPLTDGTQDFVKTLLFKTSAFTGIDLIHKSAQYNDINIRLTSLESIDIMRSLVLSVASKRFVGNRVRVQHYFLNLFRSSPNYNNGITRLRTSGGDIEDIEVEQDMDIEYAEEQIDLNAPDEDIRPNVVTKPDSPTQSPIRQHSPMEGIEFSDPNFGTNFNFEFHEEQILDEEEDDEEQFYEDPGVPVKIGAFPGEQTVPEPVIETEYSVYDTHVVNRHLEESHGMVKYLKTLFDNLKPVNKLKGSALEFNNFFDTLRAIITLYNLADMDPANTIKRMYGANSDIFKLTVPVSAICLAHLNF